MHERSRAPGGATATGRTRPRWVQVRVHTDEGPLIGMVRLEGTRSSLYELLDDGRAYLALWNARRPGGDGTEEYVAIHKSAIRSVALEIGAAVAVGTAQED